MSYILDALRKADAQRQAGMAPSLHSDWDTTASTQPAAQNNRALAIVLLTLSALAAGAAVAWLLPRPSLPAQPAVAQAAASNNATAAVEAAAAPPPLQTLPQPSFAAAPLAAEAVEPELPPAPPLRSEPRPAPPADRRPAKAPSPGSPPANAATLPQPATPEAYSYRSLPTLQELPAALQQAIPPLTLGGYIYSSKQAERSILINKRLRQEGDEIAPDFRLENMTPEGLILNYQGKRFRQGY